MSKSDRMLRQCALFEHLAAEIMETPKLLHPLDKQHSSSGKGYLAEDPRMPAHLLAQFAQDPDDLIRGAVARNENTPPAILALLAQDAEELVRMSVSMNKKVSPVLLSQLANDSSEHVRQKVAKNPNVSVTILIQLAKDKVSAVRREVAKNLKTPPHLLAQLSNDPSDMVAEYAVENPNFPPSNRKEEDSEGIIGRYMRQRTANIKLAGVPEELKKKHPHLADKIDFFIQKDPTKKYLEYEVKVLVAGQALEQEIADVIALFHKYKEKLDKKDINAWNFTELRDRLFEIRDFGGDPSKRQKKKELKEAEVF